jgi:hypothetical protein
MASAARCRVRSPVTDWRQLGDGVADDADLLHRHPELVVQAPREEVGDGDDAASRLQEATAQPPPPRRDLPGDPPVFGEDGAAHHRQAGGQQGVAGAVGVGVHDVGTHGGDVLRETGDDGAIGAIAAPQEIDRRAPGAQPLADGTARADGADAVVERVGALPDQHLEQALESAGVQLVDDVQNARRRAVAAPVHGMPREISGPSARLSHSGRFFQAATRRACRGSSARRAAGSPRRTW